jgi:hypothetical protein
VWGWGLGWLGVHDGVGGGGQVVSVEGDQVGQGLVEGPFYFVGFFGAGVGCGGVGCWKAVTGVGGSGRVRVFFTCRAALGRPCWPRLHG